MDREPTVIRAGELPGTMTEATHVLGRGGFVHREGLGSGVGLQYELDARWRLVLGPQTELVLELEV